MNKAHGAGDTDELKTLVMEVLIKRTDGVQEISIPFIEVFIEACIIQRARSDILVENNSPAIRYQLLENLVKDGYVRLNPQEEESIYLTQRAIDEFYSK